MGGRFWMLFLGAIAKLKAEPPTSNLQFEARSGIGRALESLASCSRKRLRGFNELERYLFRTIPSGFCNPNPQDLRFLS
jgi:hypothetical protein